jgi:hypothetical protein
MLSTEAKIKKRLFDDFGESAIEFFEIKKRQRSILKIDDLPMYIQHRIILDFSDDLYGDILSKERLHDRKFNILFEVYGFYDALVTIIWSEYFKGSPPIGFISFFFGSEVGDSLVKIEERKRKINDIYSQDDIEQFLFLNTMIDKLFENNEFFRKQVISNMMRYFMFKNESNAITFKQLVRQNGLSQNEMTLHIGEYVLSGAADATIEEKREMVRAAGVIRSTNTEQKFTNDMDGAGKRLISGTIERQVIDKIGKFISPIECTRIILDAKTYSGITTFENASSIKKMMFMNYIINNTSIQSASDQRERLVRNQLLRILGM